MLPLLLLPFSLAGIILQALLARRLREHGMPLPVFAAAAVTILALSGLIVMLYGPAPGGGVVTGQRFMLALPIAFILLGVPAGVLADTHSGGWSASRQVRLAVLLGVVAAVLLWLPALFLGACMLEHACL